MKRIISLLVLGALIGGCTSYDSGELVGVPGRKAYTEPDPFGMLFIPAGSYMMGTSDQDITWTQNVVPRTVTVDAFWMDETEITNNEYRQFVFWVRDSIIRKELAVQGIEDFIMKDLEGVPYEDDNGDPIIDWDAELDISKDREGNIKQIIEDLGIYYSGAERLSPFARELNVSKLIYNYYWVDHNQAAKSSNRYHVEYSGGNTEPVVLYEGTVVRPDGTVEDVTSRASFLNRDWVAIYPDTLVWVADFTYSYNEPMVNMYFNSPSYDNYPVVGITWKQAKAFCRWRTNLLNRVLARSDMQTVQDYRLPIEAEWEYAARGNLDHSMYPWGGVYLRNRLGCFVANFKPLRGNYTDDGSLYPTRVGTFAANEYGLYDMAGNVSEWTITAYDPSAYVFSDDMNPYYNYDARPDDPPVMKRKVIRGGSWKDVARYLQVSVRDYEYQDTAKSYIGFRCVRSYLGAN
ncbi:MAG: SUMF1/EgtB/PvdO family nonheme iron enzyme [Bacteroidales bacterium]|nr:SUMF1/EgtB/PvdO family nonheme iron enzyme [Bacteroidales bacterium]MBN2698546.1 SUMF1/EgtB/PvdO family nonheme iron enzyme [Bacteroidales bacterium]